LALPDQISERKRGNAYDYEATQPGLAFSSAYNTGKGTIATVYVYTLGLPYVPPSVDYPVMGQLRQQTVGEIVGFAKQRNETAKQVESERVAIATEVGEIAVLFDEFVIDSPLGARKTYAWLWSSRGHILKVRITSPA